MKWTPQEAIEAQTKGELEKWIHDFLLAEGNNKALSDGLKKEKRFWFGPSKLPLERLIRVCGPEDGMIFPESEENWHKRIQGLKEYIEEGNDLPPFIVQYDNGKLIINDGSHRYGAYQELGWKEYWTIVRFDSEEDYNYFIKQ